MYRLATLALAMLLLAGCSMSSITAKRQIELAADHVADGSLHVESRNGGIEVVTVPDATEVTIEATIRCAGATLEEATLRAENSRIEVSRDTSRTLHIRPVFDGGARSNDGASFVVRTPDANGVIAESGNGRITVTGTRGDLVARSSNGRITIKNHAGPAKGTSSNGRIEMHDVHGPAIANTSNGAIVITLTADNSGPVQLDTSNGSVKLVVGHAFGGALHVDTSNGSIRLEDHADLVQSYRIDRSSGTIEFAADGKRSSIDTSNGSITIATEASEAPE